MNHAQELESNQSEAPADYARFTYYVAHNKNPIGSWPLPRKWLGLDSAALQRCHPLRILQGFRMRAVYVPDVRNTITEPTVVSYLYYQGACFVTGKRCPFTLQRLIDTGMQ